MRCFIAIILNLLVAYIVKRWKSLNFKAIILAYILGVAVMLKSSFAYIMFGIYFFFVQILEQRINKVENRTALQVFCNGIMAVLALVLDWQNSYKSLGIFLCLLASSLADCVASDIGTIYASKVYSIVTLKQIQKGLSGGISIVGCCASFLSVVLFSMVYGICSNIVFGTFSVQLVLEIIIWGFAGMMLDSLLGETLQKKYYCSLYDKICEEQNQCQYMTNISRWKILSNNGVNLVTSIILFFILEIAL